MFLRKSRSWSTRRSVCEVRGRVAAATVARTALASTALVALAVVATALALAWSGTAYAQGVPSEPAVESVPADSASSSPGSVAGDFSVSYAFPVLGATTAPNAGPLIRANLSFVSQARQVAVSADPFGLRSQSVSLELKEDDEAFSLEYTRTPATGVSPDVGAKTDVQAVVVANPAGAPTVQALVASQHTEGASGSLAVVARLGLSDRYRDPYQGVSSIDWRATWQTTTTVLGERAGTGSGGAAASSERTSTTSGFGVRAAFGGERSRTFRPTLDVDWTVLVADRGAATASTTHGWRLRTGLGVDVTAHESVSARADWDLRETQTGTTQTLAVTSVRLAPLRLTVTVGRSSSVSGGSATHANNWGLDGDAPLGSLFTVGAGYRGEADDDGSGHGARVRLGVRSRGAGLTLRANLEGGGMWRTDAAFRPSASMSLAATTPDDRPLSFTVSASLRYDQRLAAAAMAAASFQTGALNIAVDAKADYAGALSLSGGATAHYDLVSVGNDRLGVQVGFEGLTTVGGKSAASVDLGLRYSFGGDR